MEMTLFNMWYFSRDQQFWNHGKHLGFNFYDDEKNNEDADNFKDVENLRQVA